VTDSHDDGPAATDAPASLAEAEEEVSRAELRAEVARARAAELRRQAEVDADETESAPARPRPWQRRRRWRVPRPSRKALGIGAASVLISGSLATTGYMVWQHYALLREQRHAAEFVAAARQGVTTLMSIDPDHAMQGVQRSIDQTTGALKSQLESTASLMVKNAQESKVTTKASVEDVAVESMTDNSAVVLVVAKSDTTNPDKSTRPSVSWRISVNIDRDGGRLKISKIEFVR
jgi:Mce-associated membrane protein